MKILVNSKTIVSYITISHPMLHVMVCLGILKYKAVFRVAVETAIFFLTWCLRQIESVCNEIWYCRHKTRLTYPENNSLHTTRVHIL